ncbi:ribonuclease J [Patescibacteria group bacterium]
MKQNKRKKIFQSKWQHNSSTIRILSLGGAGLVTKNMYVYEYRVHDLIKDILIVDCGIGFPDPEMYGVDVVIPDSRYLHDKKHLIRGVVFSHGHDDHIGAIPYIYPQIGPVKMWGTKLTAAFANLKLHEAKIKQRVAAVSFKDTLKIGPFELSFIRLTHSIPDTAHIVIKTPIGIFYHGSDYKFDLKPLDKKVSEISKINAVGKEKIRCVLTDCLGSERRGFTQSEKIIGETLEREFAACKGKFFFTTTSSNISRIQLAIDIARKHDRSVAFIGRSIDKNVEAASKLGYVRIPREFIVRDRDLKRLHPSKQCIIVAGSQGQPESAISRIAYDNHKYIHLEENDTVVISSDPIPGNEYNVNALIDQLYRKGARVSYSDIMEDLHVSGHGSQSDMMYLLSMLGPEYIIPIGGTYRHIVQYRRLAEEIGYQKKHVLIPGDGEVLEFASSGAPKIVDKISINNIMVDGLGVGDISNVVLRDRKTLAKDGIVVIVIPIDQYSGKVVSDPDIISRGFVYMKKSEDLVNKAKMSVKASLSLKKGKITNWQHVRMSIIRNLEKKLAKEIKRYPLIVPVIIEV